jgi:hypothetical protein
MNYFFTPSFEDLLSMVSDFEELQSILCYE